MTRNVVSTLKAGSLAFLCAAGLWTQHAKAESAELPPVLTVAGELAPAGIVSLERVTLGDVEQTILIRGASADLPVLLFLHGGPGGSVMPWVDLFHTPLLENSFVVVHWDQRGTGASYDASLRESDISVEHFVADTLELTVMLQQRFGQERIFLGGQSWGSALGFLTIAEDSTPFHAFIATSERVDWEESMLMGYEWALEQARGAGDEDKVAELEGIAPFDAFDAADLAVQRAAVDQYLGGDYHDPKVWDRYLDYVMAGESPYYTPQDVQNYMPGLELSSKAIERAEILRGYDLFQTHPSIPIPVHFITGARDRNTPADLAQAYFKALDAPAKSFTRIEGAAHMVMFEQPEVWAETLVAIRDKTLGSR